MNRVSLLLLSGWLLVLPAVPSSAELTNVALQRPVVVSSQNSANTPGWAAVDGLSSATARRWVSNNTPPHWIEVQLDGHHKLSQLKFWTGANGSYAYPAQDFSLQYWDGVSWQNILSETDHTSSGVVDISFASILASDRIRLHVTKMSEGSQNQMRLFELEVYGLAHDLQTSAYSPSRGGSIHDLTTPVYVDFSANINAVDLSGVTVLRKSDGASIGVGSVSVSGNRLSLSPGLSYSENYEVIISAGAVALEGDPSAQNAPIFWAFEVLPAQPLVSSHSDTPDIHDPLSVTFDRPVTLLDAGKIRVLDLSDSSELPVTGITLAGNQLVLSHGPLDFRRSYLIEVQAGAVQSPTSGISNNRIALLAYTDEFVVLPEVTFANGLDGFLTGFTEGLIGNEVRRWSWLAGDNASSQNTVAGPGGDFTWVGTNRRYEGDFAATPALQLEAGEEYTLTFKYMLNNSDLRVDFRQTAFRDAEVPPTAQFANNFGASSVGNLTVAAETSGPHHFVFSNVYGSHGFPWLRIDDVSVVRTVAPVIHFASPEYGAEVIEGTPIEIAGDAFGVSADLAWVRVYLDDRLLGTFTQSAFSLTLTDYDPGEQNLRIVARDIRGVESEVSQPLTVLFTDGTLAPFVQYSFRDGLEGVTTSGSILNGYLNFNPSDGVVWISTPRLFLQAGETYTFQFDAHRGDSRDHPLFLSVEDEPGYPIEPTVVASFNVNKEEWVRYEVSVAIEASGPYFFTLFNDGSQTWNRLRVDNLRVIGNFNSAPIVSFTGPVSNTITLAGAPLTLSANASDADGHVTRVEFWNGSLLIGSVFEPPYSWLWESAPVGDLTITAVAYDNTGGFSNPASLHIKALENRVNISTNMGTASTSEFIRGMEYQQDGTLVMGGVIHPDFFTGLGVTPRVLSSATPGQNGVIVRMSEDGRTVLSASVVGEAVADISLDAEGNIYAAVGPTGIVKLNPTADTVLWHHTPAAMGIAHKLAHRIDAAPNGMTAALMSATTTYGAQTLAAGDVALVHPDGTLHPVLMAGSGSTYTTDVAVDAELERVWITGWKNFITVGEPTGGSTFPVDVPIFAVRSYAAGNFNERVIRGYDWESNDDNGRWLNRLDNNMADTRTQRVTIAPNGDVYIGLEYDGGNTPIRYDPYDLSVVVQLVGGDQYHNNAFTSTVPKVAVIRLDRVTGAFKTGQYMTNRLNSGADNTIRLTEGGLLVDDVGRVHVVGSAAAGTPLTFDALPGRYNGGGVHWVLSPDLSTREMVTRWAASGGLHAVAVSPSGKVAVGGSLTGDLMYRRRAMLSERQSSSDALMVVGDFGDYYSFQPGNHPRLFFTADDIPEMRYRATLAPFDDMVQTLIESRDHNGDYLPFDPEHSYSRSMRAKINAFLYVITGDESYAIAAREDVEWVIAGTHYAWADPGLMGLRSYWMATHVALAYDWCAMSPHWDDAFLFQVSKSLLDIGKVIVNNGGTEQNTSTASNWQGARGSAGGLALLATDSRFDPALLDAAYNRVRNYLHSSLGTHPESRGWAPEGIGYTYYPYGLFVGPFGMAMANLDGRDLRAETAISAAYRSLLSAPTAAVNVYDYGGIKPDWANDNMHIRGEGVYGQAFYYIDPALLPAARYVFDRFQGPLSPDRARWDDGRGGTIWSFLHYPADVPAQSPLEFHAWQTANLDPHGIGIFAFRNQFQDEGDILSQFKARLFTEVGHDGPDGLGFRIIGNDTAWVVGGGRDNPGKSTSQATLYKVDPDAQLAAATNLGTGTLVGTPLVKVDGGGHVIAEMASNNMGVANHKRWYMTDFDSAATGAQAAFLVADTSADATYWQLPTSPFNTVTTSGNTFTITAPNGATLQGTVLHPAGAVLAHGTRSRGSAFSLQFGGSLAEADPVMNPQVSENKFVTVQSSGGDFLIAFTIQPAGETHPAVSRTSGTVADAVVQIGARSYGITADNILYDGQPYMHPDAQIVFDAGDGVVLDGTLNQTVSYGGSPVAPVIEAPAGYVFLGWSHAFDAITRDMVIEAVYAPIEGTPIAPSFLRGTAPTGGFIALQWNDNSIGETGFTVEESSDGGQSWFLAAALPENSTGVQLSGRAPSSEYRYRVRAEGTEAPSAWSNTLVLNTPPLNLPPFFTSEPPAVAHEGTLFNYYLQAEDPDEDSMTLTLIEGPEWLSLYNFGGGNGVLTGVPVADAETVDVVVSVSDGINPAVEQSFTLTVNAAPVINLVWPGSVPVYLSPRHGIYVEAEVTDDDAPISVTWEVVQGPAGTRIGDAHALDTEIYFDRAGTYAVRLTAVDALGARSELEFPVLVDRQPTRETADVLAFSNTNSYVTASTTFRNTGPESLNLDIDGDGITDTRRWYPFSTRDADGNWLAPLNPSQSANVHGGRFYGGLVAERFGSTTLNSTSQIDGNNQISVRFSSNYPARMHLALFWLREDFMNLDPSGAVLLGEASRFDVVFGDFRDIGDLRWMVLANGKFYVSQTLIANTVLGRTLDGFALGTEMWAEYTPTAPIGLNFDQAAAQFTISSAELGTIEGVGLMADADDYTSFSRRFQLQIREFKLRAEIAEAFHAAPLIALDNVVTVEAGSPADLFAGVDFDPDGSNPATLWTVVYGPGTVTFGDPESAQTTVTASLPGEYKLRLSAWDDGQSSFREAVWVVDPAEGPDPTALELWRQDQFGHLTGGVDHPDAAILADPDGDGIANLLEFALGGSPFVPNSAQLPESASVEIDGQRYLTLSASRNPDAADITFVVEVSDDLAAWRSAPGEDVVILTDTPSLLEVRSAQPISPGAPQFIRLRVVKTE